MLWKQQPISFVLLFCDWMLFSSHSPLTNHKARVFKPGFKVSGKVMVPRRKIDFGTGTNALTRHMSNISVNLLVINLREKSYVSDVSTFLGQIKTVVPLARDVR